MSIKIETDKGWTEAVIDENCNYDKFYLAVVVLEKDFQVEFSNKLEDLDSLYWEFTYEGSKLMLHYNIYFGVSIFPKAFKLATSADNEMVTEIANLLFDKLNKN